MFRGNFVKRSVLQGIPIVNSPVLRFHLTSKTLSRGVLRKNRLNNAEKHLEIECEPIISNKSNTNFLGVESEEGVITVSSNVNSTQQSVLKRKLREKFYRASFGVIRYDSDNKLKFHGQYGKTNNVVFPRNSNDYSEVSGNFAKVISSSNPTYDNFEVDRLDCSVKSSEIYENYTNCNSDVLNKESYDLHDSVKHDQDASYIDQYYFNNSYKENEQSSENINDPPSVSAELNFIDQNYFGDLTVSENKKLSQKQDFFQNTFLVQEADTKGNDKNFLDNLKFDNAEDEKLNSFQSNPESSLKYKKDDIFEDTFFNPVNEINASDRKHETNINSSKNITDAFYNQANKINTSYRKCESNINSQNRITEQFNTMVDDIDMKSITDSINVTYNLPFEENYSKSKSSEKLKEKLNEPSSDKVIHNYHPTITKPFVNIEDPKHSKNYVEESTDVTGMTSAYDFVKNLQKQNNIPGPDVKKGNRILDIRVDSKGFRILKNQVNDLSYFTRDEIINLLKQNILYSDDNLLILNKPYSLVMHESQTTKFPCLSAFLDELANEMSQQTDNPKLHTVHRLDKETTGCLLLARNEMMSQNLKSLFAQRKIIKKYWVLTSGVPDPPEGVIDIPIAEGSVESRKRMVLHPEIPKDIAYKNHSKRGKPAVTSYKVLSESGNAALVEATPLTGIKHQIRVHFGFGLCCPILGDHKYSHLDKLAPQKLPSDILQRLHVRQSKVRYIPLHIHAKSVIIPGYFEGRDLYVKAPLPNHMIENLKKLKFKK